MDTADPADELRQLRDELQRLRELVERLENADLSGSVSAVAIVNKGPDFPTAGAIGMTYLVSIQDVTGDEAEGAEATFTARDGQFPAVCLTETLPTNGQQILIHQVGSAWVFLL